MYYTCDPDEESSSDGLFLKVVWLALPGEICRRRYVKSNHTKLQQPVNGVQELVWTNECYVVRECMVDFQVRLYRHNVFEAKLDLKIPDTAWMYYIAGNLTDTQQHYI